MRGSRNSNTADTMGQSKDDQAEMSQNVSTDISHDLTPQHQDSATVQARKEKKRVGFSSHEAQPALDHPIEEDYFGTPDWTDGPATNPFDTPNREQHMAGDVPNAVELHQALTKILTSEAEGKPVLRRPPRPVLRSNTSYIAPEEREQADLAEKRATERQHRSGLEARQRANQLAVTIESYSSPPSRRGSNDMAHFPVLGDRDDDDAGASGRTTALDEKAENSSKVRSRPRNNSHLAAENLVRAYSRRTRPEDIVPGTYSQEHSGLASGAVTPTFERQYAHDYVPRPENYRGGILASLLKLYNEAEKDASGGSSGFNTPATAPTTPLMTPNHSPPGSVSNSRPSSPKPRPNGGLFGYQRSPHSRSSLALTQMMKSTSTLLAPGSSGISEGFSEKLKHDAIPKAKKRRSGIFGGTKSSKTAKMEAKHRITVHIAQIISRHRYLVKLCKALMMYGAPTHRLEEYMTMSSRVLEIEGQFLYIPGCMIISFDDSSTHTTEVKIVRAPQGVDLGKMRDVHEIYKQVVHDSIGVDEATTRLEKVMDRKLKFGNWMRVPIYGLASACVAPFAFEGRFIDLPIAFILGCILGWMQLILAPSNELYANVFEITAAIATSFLARMFGSLRGGQLFCFSALAQSSIALILPGYMVLCSSLELQSNNLVAGSVRMVYAMIYTLFLGYGITIGTTLYGLIDPDGATSETHCTEPLGRNWYFLFVPAFTMCLCIINQAKWKQTPVMLIISLSGFLVNSYSSIYFAGNTQISNMLGALTVGILANLYSRLGRHVENAWLDALEWWDFRVTARFSKNRQRNTQWPRNSHSTRSHQPVGDVESAPGTPLSDTFPDGAQGRDQTVRQRTVGFGLAAAAMLPAIFVQVPSGLAAGGSLLAGVTSANQVTSTINGTIVAGSGDSSGANNTTFTVLYSVIQVAIGITVGLFLSALIVYPLGKRRSGLRSGLLSF